MKSLSERIETAIYEAENGENWSALYYAEGDEFRSLLDCVVCEALEEAARLADMGASPSNIAADIRSLKENHL